MKYIVTSALPYVQSIIHLGNLAGSILPADIYYKFLRIRGDDAIFICGSDQHGTALELRALLLKVKPEEFAEKLHKETKKLLEDYECTFTYYGKTHTEQNKEVVYEIFEKLWKNGYLSKIDSEQPYCNIDKRFISDRFIEGTCPICGYASARGDQCDNCQNLLEPKDLIRPYCTICKKSEIVFKKTTNLAFDLPKLQGQLKKFIKENSKNHWSKNAVNHSLGYIERGLKPREITRDISWGFRVPLKGFEDKVLYVWFDAPIGYIGITKEWNPRETNSYWKGKETRLVQFMGKDNIEFHTLLWPGFLIGSELGYVLPHTIQAYEFLMWNKQKFSKSRGIGLDIREALEVMPAEYWRFVLASLLPETSDTDFSVDLLRQTVDNDMNNVVGNFIHRTLTLTKNIFGGRVPEVDEKNFDAETKRIIEEVGNESSKYQELFERIEIREALRSVVSIAAIGNALMSNTEPWNLAKSKKKEDKIKLGNTIYVALDIVHKLGVLLYPFTPTASGKILNVFSEKEAGIKNLKKKLKSNEELKLGKLTPLFQKLTPDQIERIKKSSGR